MLNEAVCLIIIDALAVNDRFLLLSSNIVFALTDFSVFHCIAGFCDGSFHSLTRHRSGEA